MFRRWLTVAVTLIAAPALAHAQGAGPATSPPASRPQLSEAVRAKAAKLFAHGTGLFNSGAFADARAEFEAA